MNKQSDYISEIDQLLEELRKTTLESASQQKEIKKAKEIALKRDTPIVKEDTKIWEKF